MANLTASQSMIMTFIILASFLLVSVLFIFLIRRNSKSFKKDKYLMINNVASLNEVLRLMDYRIKNSKGKIYFTLLLVSLDSYDRLFDLIGSQGVMEYLTKVTEALRKSLPIGAKMAQTTEAETFLIYLPEYYGEEGMQEMAQMFKNTAERLFYVRNSSAPVRKTASVAVTVYPEHGDNVIKLINNLLAAMYGAKKSGGNELVYYNPEMNKDSVYTERYKDFKQAIDNGKMILRYHPLIGFESGEIGGAQVAVSRLNDNGSVTEFKHFLPYLEESEDDFWFTAWCIEKAVVNNIEIFRSDKGRDYFITLNAGLKFLTNLNAAFKLQVILEQYGINPRNVALELSNLLENEWGNRFAKNLLQMQGTGIRIAADIASNPDKDLSKLIEVFDVDIIKINISDILSDNKRVSALLKLAHNHRKKVIVWGIENSQHIDKLKTKSVSYTQGSYYGQALTKEQLINKMQI